MASAGVYPYTRSAPAFQETNDSFRGLADDRVFGRLHDGREVADCSSSCLRSVMFRAMWEAPMTRPVRSQTGEMVRETSISSPFFLRRTVSKWSTFSPRPMRCRISVSSSWRGREGEAGHRGSRSLPTVV